MELSEEQIAFLRREQQYAQNPWKWVCEQVVTLDEASKAKRRWPANRTDLQDLFWILQNFEKTLWIPKSRRTMISWSIASYATWLARYHDHNFIMLSSRTEKEAAYLVGERCKFIEDNLVDPFCAKSFDSWKTKDGIVGKIIYKGTKSTLLAVPEGQDVVRSYTFSLFIMDESDFQNNSQEAYNSALPQIEKEARVIVLTTSDGPGKLMSNKCKEIGFYSFADYAKLESVI